MIIYSLKHLKILFCCSAVILLYSCIAYNSDLDKSKETTAAPPEKPSIVFINYTIFKNQNNLLNAKVVNKIITKGIVKNKNNKASNYNNGDLKCVQLSKKNDTLATQIIPNPINKQIEYVNASGALNTKTIALDSAQFSVRMQLHKDSKYIILKKINTSNTTPLNKLML